MKYPITMPAELALCFLESVNKTTQVITSAKTVAEKESAKKHAKKEADRFQSEYNKIVDSYFGGGNETKQGITG